MMSLKRTPADEEIEALAEQFRPLWRHGDVVRPWLRQHHGMLLDLVHGDWSWASIGLALTAAGITYRTGKPWTAKLLRSEFSRAQAPLKGYRRRKPPAEAIEATSPAITTVTPPVTVISPTNPPPVTPSTPRFKPAAFRVDPSHTPGTADHPQIEHTRRPSFGPPDSKG